MAEEASFDIGMTDSDLDDEELDRLVGSVRPKSTNNATKWKYENFYPVAE